jgi:hypothetical protein
MAQVPATQGVDKKSLQMFKAMMVQRLMVKNSML